MKNSRPDRIERIVPFTAGDGFACNLINVRGPMPAWKGAVLLVHGAGVRANIFRAPVETTIVDYLIDNGYDVWLENWRASIDFAPNEWTLDQAALHDHPEAVKTVVRETGHDTIKAIIHCQGSTSFMMSAMAGLVPEVTTIVTNAVSLHPVVPKLSAIKLRYTLPLIGLVCDYLNPQWGLKAPTPAAKAIALLVELTHHECDNPVCKQVSFTYGSGFPALWRHENLNDGTHEWLKNEFANCPITFYKQMSRSVRNGVLMAEGTDSRLPENFVKRGPQTNARIHFYSGDKNLCFLPESQERSYDYLNSFRKDYHSLRILPDYSHLDIFMGKNAAADVFPLMLEDLEREGVREG
jgi:hypothetical protein